MLGASDLVDVWAWICRTRVERGPGNGRSGGARADQAAFNININNLLCIRYKHARVAHDVHDRSIIICPCKDLRLAVPSFLDARVHTRLCLWPHP
jgi:hypothetical protein